MRAEEARQAGRFVYSADVKGNEGFLLTVLGNILKDIAKKKRLPTISIDKSLESSACRLKNSVASFAPSPSTRVMQDEQELLLAKAIESIPEDDRVATILRYVEALSYAEIADTLGISRTTATRRVTRGTQLLKEKLRCLNT